MYIWTISLCLSRYRIYIYIYIFLHFAVSLSLSPLSYLSVAAECRPSLLILNFKAYQAEKRPPLKPRCAFCLTGGSGRSPAHTVARSMFADNRTPTASRHTPTTTAPNNTAKQI